MTSISAPISFGLIGCGGHSQEIIIPSLNAMHSCKCLWVSDPDEHAAKLASSRLNGGSFFVDWNEAITSAVPQAIICAATPNVHTAVARHAMTNGVPLFIEKPVCESFAEALELAETERLLSAFVQVGHNLRFSEAGKYMKDICSQDSIGRHSLISLNLNASGRKGKRWAIESSVKAFLLGHLTHAIDYILHLSSPDLSIQPFSRAYCDGDNVSVATIFSLIGGGLCSISATNLGNYHDFCVTVIGEYGDRVEQKGLASIDFFSRDLSKGWSRRWHAKTLQAGPDKSGYHEELLNFFNRCRNRKLLNVGANLESSASILQILNNLLI